MTIKDRIAQLKAWDTAYFTKDAPLITDAEYDVFREGTRKLDPANPYFTKVGAPVDDSAWVKVRHTAPMTSLNKVLNPAELTTWLGSINSVLNTSALFITNKLDGLSCSLRYENGTLIRAVTRGDGFVGEDITRNVRQMRGVPSRLPFQLPSPLTGHVRGEIVLRKSQFEKHFRAAGYKNCRNAAGGAAKDLSGERAAFLDVFCYDWLPDGEPLASKEDEFAALARAGFQVPSFAVTRQNAAGVLQVYEAYIRELRAGLDYEIDGLVISVNQTKEREALGETGHCPEGVRAFKFPAASAETVLRDIVWQVGASGRITPVAIFDPIDLAGATVTRASLHNIALIRQLVIAGLSQLSEDERRARMTCRGNNFVEGDVIRTARCGDVIPGVEALVQPGGGGPLLSPSGCPTCGTVTVMIGEYLVCPNKADCEAQTIGAIKRWIVKLGVKDFGGALCEALCEAGLVQTPADLYRLTVANLANLQFSGRRVGESTATTALDNLRARMALPLHVLVGSLGIQLWSRSMCKLLVSAGYSTLDKMAAACADSLSAIDGVGPIKAEAFVAGFEAVRPVIDALLAVGITVSAEADGLLRGKTVCLTGFRDAALDAAIEAAGGTVKSSVGKGLSFLVAKNPSESGGKLDKARAYGVTILGIEEFKRVLAG